MLGITKVGSRHVRMLLTEASQCYTHGEIEYKSKELKSRQSGNSPQIIAYADKANERLRLATTYWFLERARNTIITLCSCSGYNVTELNSDTMSDTDDEPKTKHLTPKQILQ